MNDDTYEGILNQDDTQDFFNGDDARPFYPERAETVMRTDNGAVIAKLQKEIAELRAEFAKLQKEIAELRAELRTYDAIVAPEINKVEKYVFEMQGLFERMTELFLCANAAKRQMRRERDAATKIVNLARIYCAADDMRQDVPKLYFDLCAALGVEVDQTLTDSDTKMREIRAALVLAEDEAVQLRAELARVMAELDLQRDAMRLIVRVVFGRDLVDGEVVDVGEICAWINGLRRENSKILDGLDAAKKRAEQAEADARALAQRVFETEILTDSEIEIVARYVPREQMEGAGYK